MTKEERQMLPMTLVEEMNKIISTFLKHLQVSTCVFIFILLCLCIGNPVEELMQLLLSAKEVAMGKKVLLIENICVNIQLSVSLGSSI